MFSFYATISASMWFVQMLLFSPAPSEAKGGPCYKQTPLLYYYLLF